MHGPIEAPRPEQGREFTTLQAIENFIDQPDNRDIILKKHAYISAIDTRRRLAKPDEVELISADNTPSYVLDNNNFNILFDPLLPTIYIDCSGSFSGGELVAVAAQRRRANNSPSCNVILAPSSTQCGAVAQSTDGKHHFELTHGIFLDGGGNVYSGELSTPVLANAVSTTNKALLAQCAEAGITLLEDPLNVRTGGRKQHISETGQQTAINTPKRYELSDLWVTEPREEEEFVIKPSNAMQGLGVCMTSGMTNHTDAANYYAFLEQHGYKPVIEQRVRSWPLHAPGTNERLDWNVRAIVSNGELIDMYIRTKTWGSAVNHASGAEALSMEDLARYVDSPETATRLYEQLLYASHRLARVLPTGVHGADITVDESLQSYLFEVNAGEVGGLQTIAGLYHQPQRKLLGPNLLLTGWMREHHLKPEPRDTLSSLLKTIVLVDDDLSVVSFGLQRTRQQPDIAERRPWAHDLARIFRGLYYLEQQILLANVAESVIAEQAHAPFDYVEWFACRQDALSAGIVDDTAVASLEKDLFRLSPLVYHKVITDIASKHPYPDQLLNNIDTLERFFP